MTTREEINHTAEASRYLDYAAPRFRDQRWFRPLAHLNVLRDILRDACRQQRQAGVVTGAARQDARFMEETLRQVMADGQVTADELPLLRALLPRSRRVSRRLGRLRRLFLFPRKSNA